MARIESNSTVLKRIHPRIQPVNIINAINDPKVIPPPVIIEAVKPADLISNDELNQLGLGKDSKLFVKPQSTTASIKRYEFTQSSPSDTWIVNHNLGVQPQITILSMGGMLMLAEIVHTSNNQAIIYFDSPTAGMANCI